MHLTPQDNDMPPLSSKDCVANRHPGQVPQSGTRAGIQKEFDYIELSLDTGSHPPQADSSGMTGSVNCDIVSKGRRDFCGVKCIGVIQFLSSCLTDGNSCPRPHPQSFCTTIVR